MIEPGQTLAEFVLKDGAGNEVSWASFRGKPVVFFFYPRADTPGCTKEACAFRDLAGEFASRGVAVVGVSADLPKKQAAFAKKYDLTMPLLSDPEKVILTPWGVFGTKMMYGKATEGIIRSTFLFDANGTLVKAWRSVKVDGHAEAVLAAVDAAFPK